MTTARSSYDLGLIIPTREEFEYVRRSVPFRPITDVDKGYWFEFSLPGQRWGVAHVLFDMGLVATAAATGRLLGRFRPEVLAVVGIGGGLSPKLALGDVVVGSVIQEYMKAAKVASDPASGTVILPSGANWPLAERLRNFTNHFKYFAEDDHRAWVRYARIRAAEDDLPLTTTPGARRQPDYHLLPIASGDFVVADPVFKQWLVSYDRMRSVIEMEAAGAARAVQEYDKDVALLVLRGVSDFADQQKSALEPAAFGGGTSGRWRCYATQNAIELLLAFLASPDFPWHESTVARRPEDHPPVSDDDVTGVTRSPTRQAWDYFMRATPLIQGVGAVATLVRELRPEHSPTAPSDEPRHQDGHHPGDAHDQRHSNYHGEHTEHGEHGDVGGAEDGEHRPDWDWHAPDTEHPSGDDDSYHPDGSHSGLDYGSHLDGYEHVTGTLG
jgi:nucleoside phosphorylase